MSGNRAWLRKLRTDSPYPSSDEIVEAVRDIIIDVLISRDLLDYADVPTLTTNCTISTSVPPGKTVHVY